MMKIKPIKSSSRGNAYQISDGQTTILIECGVSLKVLRSSVDLSRVDACLITHEHRDHAASAMQLAEKMIPIYASRGTLSALSIGFMGQVVEPLKVVNVGTFEVIGFPTKHDASEPMGFYIRSSAVPKERLLFATDTYYIHHQFGAIDYLMIECNYSEEILLNNLAKSCVSLTQAKRLRESHFELENVKSFIKKMDKSRLKRIYLMHLSNKNSNEFVFKNEIQKIAGIPVIVCPE